MAGGSVTSTKQFVWCGDERCEVRDASGALLNQYFARGQVNFSGGTGTSYYYTLRHDGSVLEMTNSSGAVVWEQSFDPYGVPTTIVNTTPSDFGYAGYYFHQRSGLNLTATRAYNAGLGRFINRDPIEEAGGLNLYSYAANDPIDLSDPSGMDCTSDCWFQFVGIGVPAIGATAATAPSITKPFSSGGVKGTSAFSEMFGRLIPKLKTGTIPTPVGFPPVMRSTPLVGRAIGRWLPYISIPITAFSIKQLVDCLNNCPKRGPAVDIPIPPYAPPFVPPSDDTPPPYVPGPNTTPWNPAGLPPVKNYPQNYPPPSSCKLA